MHRIFLAVAALVAAPAIASETEIRYEVVDLGRTDEHSEVCPCFFPQALSDSGAVAGFFFGTDGTYNAFVTDGENMIDISGSGENRTFARGINDAGHAVGWTDQFSIQHAFLWDGRTLHDLGTLGGTYSDAHDINNAGQVVGDASTHPTPDEESHAALWQDGSWTDLGTLGGPFSEALAISDGGVIVGWSWNEAWDARAVYWTADLEGPFELPTFSTPERFTYANDVNEAGVIVGQVQIESFEGLTRYRAALWQDGEVLDLGVLPEAGQGISLYGATAHVSTAARSINDAGVIVGMSTPQSDSPQLRPGPFVHRDGVMVNLNDLLIHGETDWVISDVAGINNAGVISGSARVPGSNFSYAVILVPTEALVGDVDQDGDVDVDDLVAVIVAWGPCLGCDADVDHDTDADVDDLVTVIANWAP